MSPGEGGLSQVPDNKKASHSEACDIFKIVYAKLFCGGAEVLAGPFSLLVDDIAQGIRQAQTESGVCVIQIDIAQLFYPAQTVDDTVPVKVKRFGCIRRAAGIFKISVQGQLQIGAVLGIV